MDKINNEVRNIILSFNSRLLERQLYLTIFEGQDISPFLKAILSYQNEDGGFGNGIEPDLMTPESNAICLETALYYFDCISFIPNKVATQTVKWVENTITASGCLKHPTQKMKNYPFQPWWANNDDYRILSIVGLLRKLGVHLPTKIKKVIYNYASTIDNKETLEIYDYPIYLFSLYCTDFKEREKFLNGLGNKIVNLCNANEDHFIPFSRYWKFFKGLIDSPILENQRKRLLFQISDPKNLPVLYRELPWWNSIFLLDWLISIKFFQ